MGLALLPRLKFIMIRTISSVVLLKFSEVLVNWFDNAGFYWGEGTRVHLIHPSDSSSKFWHRYNLVIRYDTQIMYVCLRLSIIGSSMQQ